MGPYALYIKDYWFGIRSILQNRFFHTHFEVEYVADWQCFMAVAVQTDEVAAQNILDS